ncbi:nucleotidyl transferase AbiEii/AbiGii toxin family protein [Candidatus Micrarchaeota archaeon]|nr:nucleotidyl transferase AbiEii/AbiGii toxin family protein [Candidatus Micrarchaeota archaeon]
MNEDFQKRSKAVFDTLKIISRIAPELVFLGGSAIQARLSAPKRLSIDLDIAYPGEVQNLVKELEKEGYSVIQRKSRNKDFLFYTISKNGVMVKLDVTKLTIPETEKNKIQDFKVFTPKLSYFLASKLSALAFGTIGRLEEEPQQILKDIFDINCILDLQPDLEKLSADWRRIIKDQNKLRKTRFTEYECLSSVQKTLLKCAQAAPLPEFFIPPHSLGSFQDMLTSGRISRKDIAVMAARALILTVNRNSQFYEIEKSVLDEAKDAKKLEEASKTLIERKYLDGKQITAIKTIAPAALMFLIQYKQRIPSMREA